MYDLKLPRRHELSFLWLPTLVRELKLATFEGPPLSLTWLVAWKDFINLLSSIFPKPDFDTRRHWKSSIQTHDTVREREGDFYSGTTYEGS
jgi:hypothetical protein